MIIVGLTGGIASGKSTVAGFFSSAGAHIVDADQIAREAVAPGAPAFNAVVSLFGSTILGPDGGIDRKRLGDIIFNDPQKKARLEAVVHPRVRQRAAEITSRIIAQDSEAVIVQEVPLLFEVGMQNDLAEVIVVYVPESVQLERLMRRDGIDKKAALARIRSQMAIDEKRKRATIVIDNTSRVADTRKQAMAVYQRLKRRAKAPAD